ncbi:PAS domain S-box protein [Jannaschia sp. S6380]|uniref:PAS domain S-box protein n=1 Tax=Jannaschia sp. S6380 TaxID=2926408 RepID=UPI001FF242CD|nr:PAS domain S-box protein [Jannaschia sp. S6380]MCK0167482.1 PAS domain S-box protein [Jannaschia sp. S6380]
MTKLSQDMVGDDLRQMLELVDGAACIGERMPDADDFRILQMNSAFRTSLDTSDAAGRTARQIFGALDRDAIDAVARITGGGARGRFRQELAGSDRIFDVELSPLAQAGRFVAVLRDMTGAGAAQVAAGEVETKFAAMIDDLPLIVWLHGADGRQEMVNQTYCDFFGVTPEEMREDRWEMLVHPDDGESYVEAFKRSMAERRDFHGSVRVRDRHGSWRKLESWGRARFDADGQYIGVVGTSADVTERDDAVARLAESEARLRMLIETSPVGIVIGKLDGLMGDANPAFLRMTGYDGDGFRPGGLRRDDFVVDEMNYPRERVERELAKTGRAGPFERRVRRADGTEFPMLMHMTQRPGHDEVYAFVTDLTDQHEAARKGDVLMREVNHRAKNMLAVIQSLARQTARDTTPEAFFAAFSARLSGLAASQDLLIAGNWDAVGLRDLVDLQMAFARGSREERVAVDGAPLSITPAAAQSIGMALHELATNALKYGALSDEAGMVDIDWGVAPRADGPRFWMTWVEHNGPPVETPSRRGFGYNVISRMAEHSVGGAVELDYRREGLVWRLEAPGQRVLHSKRNGERWQNA